MKYLLFASIASGLLFVGPVSAQGTSETACAQAFDQCLQQCETDHPGDAAGKAACVPTCSGKYAACDAGVAYEKAKPWLEEQADKTKRFLEDLMDGLKDEEPTATPQSKDKSI